MIERIIASQVPLFHVKNWVGTACKNFLKEFKLFRVQTKIPINVVDFELKSFFQIAKSISIVHSKSAIEKI